MVVTLSYDSQATRAFLGMLPLCLTQLYEICLFRQKYYALINTQIPRFTELLEEETPKEEKTTETELEIQVEAATNLQAVFRGMKVSYLTCSVITIL